MPVESQKCPRLVALARRPPWKIVEMTGKTKKSVRNGEFRHFRLASGRTFAKPSAPAADPESSGDVTRSREIPANHGTYPRY